MSDFYGTFRGHTVPNLHLIERKRWWFFLSAFLIALSGFGLLVRQLNLSIDFEGGALLSYRDTAGLTVEDVRGTLAAFDRGDAEVQAIGGGEISIRTGSLSGMDADRTGLIEALARQAGISSDEVNVQDVGPTWGGQISRKALQGLLVFLVLVSIYISFRFEWKMAVAAQVALFHDLIITAGIYGLVGREVTPGTVIAILTILGYSLYDTVVIFDKINENTESVSLVARETYSGVVNLSLNQTLMRSVNTSLTTLFPITALLLFGGETLKDFAFALFVGVGTGTYSSIFVAAPIVAVLKEREPKHRQIRTRLAARAAVGKEPVRAVSAAGEGRATGVPTTEGPASAAARPKPKSKKKKPAAKRRRR